MKYAIDRIEENIAILESINDKTQKEVPIKVLPSNIKEGTILTYENNIYIFCIIWNNRLFLVKKR